MGNCPGEMLYNRSCPMPNSSFKIHHTVVFTSLNHQPYILLKYRKRIPDKIPLDKIPPDRIRPIIL